jgi:hypothetical protein
MKTSLSAGYCSLFKVQGCHMNECKGCINQCMTFTAVMPSPVSTSKAGRREWWKYIYTIDQR